MINKFNLHLARVIAALALVLSAGATAAPLKSPADVKVALRLMMQVTNDFDRQISHKTYNRLPHENQEFGEATGALRQAIGGEPAPFKAQVTPLIDQAVKAAQKTADQSARRNDAELRADQHQLVVAVNRVFAHFPADLRPDPNVQPGHP